MSFFRFASAFVDRAQIAKELDAVVKDISHQCDPLAAILFGSAARNEAREDSDFDICLIFDSEAEVRAARRSLYARRPIHQRSIDFILWSTQAVEKRLVDGGLIEILKDEGKILFLKQNYLLPWPTISI